MAERSSPTKPIAERIAHNSRSPLVQARILATTCGCGCRTSGWACRARVGEFVLDLLLLAGLAPLIVLIVLAILLFVIFPVTMGRGVQLDWFHHFNQHIL